MMVMKPEEAAAVQALSLHALSCLALAASLAPPFVRVEDEPVPGAMEDGGALLAVANRDIDDAADIIASHRGSLA